MDTPKIRPIERRDHHLPEEFFYYAIFVPEGVEAPPREIIYRPEIFVYVDGFGEGGGRGDLGIVAEVGGEVTGAVWTWIIPAFGHLDVAGHEDYLMVKALC